MDRRTSVAVMIVAAVAVLSAAAVVVVGFFGGDQKDDSGVVYTLYIGMQDSETHVEYDRDAAAAIIDPIVLQYSEGLTRYEAMGAFTYGNGTLSYESSLVYVLVGPSLEEVHAIADQVKDALNQESVMITYDRQGVEFY